MPYDSTLDNKLYSKSIETELSVYSYNEGAKKLQISRENKAQEDYRFSKLGRLSKEEAEGILPLMQEAIKEM